MSERPIGDDESGPAPDASLTAHVESYDGAPDECTIYPTGIGDDDRTTRWITARGDSYVGVSEMR